MSFIKKQRATTYICEDCNQTFSRYGDKMRHEKRIHQINCETCQKVYSSKTDLKIHMLEHTPRIIQYQVDPVDTNKFTVETTQQMSVTLNKIKPREKYLDMIPYQNDLYQLILNMIKENTNMNKACKRHFIVTRLFEKPDKVEEQFEAHFTTPVSCSFLQSGNELDQNFTRNFELINLHIDQFQNRGSGWQLKDVGRCQLYMVKYIPIRAGGYIELPMRWKNKKSIINIKTDEKEDCFVLSILAELHPADDNVSCSYKYRPYISTLDTSCLQYPVSVDQIDTFEHYNTLAIDVYGLEGNNMYPLRQSKHTEWQIITLLLIQNDKGQHYCLITDLDQCLSDGHHTPFNCRRCLMSFRSKVTKDQHAKNCMTEGQCQSLPDDENKIIKFNNIRAMHRLNYVFMADLETLIEPIFGPVPNPKGSYTMETAKHSVLLAGCIGSFQCCGMDTRRYTELKIYEGEMAMLELINFMIHEGHGYQNEITHNKKPYNLSTLEKDIVKKTQICWICKLDIKPGSKVIDHCHWCGRFRSAICYTCNLEYRKSRDIHVYFHNFSGFDSTFVVPALANIAKSNNYELNCLAKEGDTFMQVSMKIPYKTHEGKTGYWRLKFLDTMSFLNGSLETLAKSLKAESSNKFHCTEHIFGNNYKNLMEKQVIPYTYFNKRERLDEVRLPPIEAFTNDLTSVELDPTLYCHAQNVWAEMGCQTLRDYYNTYLKCDITLLADIWESFREFSIEHYQLDAARFISGPGLTYSAMLRMTGVELELTTDHEMWEMMCKGIRGGLSVIGNRVEFSNYHDDINYNPCIPYNFLYFVDAVNLYGWSMQQYLAIGNYEWLSADERVNFDVNTISFESDKGFLIECGLEYPNDLHDAHDSNPLAPELMSIDENMLSEYQRNQLEKYGLKASNIPKLVAHLGPRINYVLDYRNLQLYLQLGMKVTCIHRVLRYDQSNWMKPYIVFNTVKRSQAKSEFQKNLFKFMNNSCFGKQLEDPTKYSKTHLCVNSSEVEKLVKQPTYVGASVYTDDLTVVNMKPKNVKLNKMRLAGCLITELAKYKMQDYYYNCIIKHFGPHNVSLCIHDTDSYLVSIKNTSNVYEKLYDLKDWHDFSKYPVNHPCYDTTHKGVPGYMAPECDGKPIKAVAGIRAKCYSILFHDNVEKKRIKGIKKHVRDNVLTFDHYFQCTTEDCNRRDIVMSLHRKKSEMFTEMCNKASLVNYDDKRYLDESLHSLAHGNYKIQNYDL